MGSRQKQMPLRRAELPRTAEEAPVAKPVVGRGDPWQRQPYQQDIWNGKEYQLPVLFIQTRRNLGSYPLCCRHQSSPLTFEPTQWSHRTLPTWINLGSKYSASADAELETIKTSYSRALANKMNFCHSFKAWIARATGTGTLLCPLISKSSKVAMELRLGLGEDRLEQCP